jgi:hypothetical protein
LNLASRQRLEPHVKRCWPSSNFPHSEQYAGARGSRLQLPVDTLNRGVPVRRANPPHRPRRFYVTVKVQPETENQLLPFL